jgi:hypothetical protein
LEDTFGLTASAQDEEAPTAAAEPEIVLLPYASGPPGAGRRVKRGRRPQRWSLLARTRQERPPVALEETSGSAVSALAEAPTVAAELMIVLLPCASGPPGAGRRVKRGRRPQRWSRPPGASPP